MKRANLKTESIGAIEFYRLMDNRRGTLLQAGLQKLPIKVWVAEKGYSVHEVESESPSQARVRELSEGRN